MKHSKLPTVALCFIGIGLLCLCGGWIVMILNAQGWFRYLIYGLFAASFIFLFLAMIFFIVSKKKDVKETEEAIDQLRRYNEGDLSQRTLSPSSEPVHTLASFINDLPLAVSSGEQPQGYYPQEEFARRLRLLLAKSSSIRGVLYLFGLQKRATPQSHGKLLRAVEDAFPMALMGEVKAGIAVYLPVALSAAEEEGRAKAFISNFVAMENETSMSPTSIGAKAVLCFYPDYDADSLLETALSHFGEADPLLILQTGESHLTPLTLAEASRKDDIAYEDFAMQLSSAENQRQRVRALRRFIIRVGFALGYDQIGLALYDPSRNAYRILEELHQEGKAPAFRVLEKNSVVASDRIDPFFMLALGNRITAVSDALLLPSRPAAILDSMGLRSIACDSIGGKENKIGFIYLTATETKKPLRSAEQAALKRFLQACREYVLLEHGATLSDEGKRRMASLTENAERYVYEIDPDTHRLLYLSENLAAAYPNAKVGQYCHKALLGLDKPCPKCPLMDASSFEKALAPLGPGLLSFTALSKAPRAMICLSKQAHSLTPRRLDQALYILNHRALMADLEKELLNDKEGVTLLFTIENALMSAGKIKNGTVDDVMASVLSRLSIASLDEGIYRFDDTTLGYLLPGTTKDEAFSLAITVAEELSSAVALQDRNFVPELSYYIFEYPVEVTCPFDLESLMRTCAAKVPSIGKGRVIPFDDSEAPVVLPRSYKEDALKKALNKGSFPLRYSLIRENSSFRPR
ncbi:MAG: hypothetical protein K6E59_01170, partial [Bacilli bacterium]|nr:hypothetical protein [Bacilli bacterium]